jgi:DNA-binding transcriptional MerR regulator/methylmalonyl-CoA mutase cobalamin-binding subunit
MAPATDARHPIGVVSERTGLTPDVLRVWERRYGVVEPKRSAGGQRIYSDADIERLSLLHRATQGGHGISHVASLSKTKLEELVREFEVPAVTSAVQFTPAGEPNSAVAQAIAFTEALDPSGLESLLRRSVARYGIVTFIDSIAAPFLREVGDGWHAGTLSVAQEHLATAVLQRVVSETAQLLTSAEGNPTVLIATLEGERHANGALMAAATAASEGWRVIYLGPDLPVDEIAEAATRTHARVIAISVVLSDKKSRGSAQLRELEKSMPSGTTLFVGGAGAKSLKQHNGRSSTVYIDSMAELHEQLAGMRRHVR